MPYRMIAKGGLLTLEERAEALQASERALREGVCYQTSFGFDGKGNPFLINGLQPPGYRFSGSPYHGLGDIVQTEEEMLGYQRKGGTLTDLWNKLPEIILDFLSGGRAPIVPLYQIGTYQRI